MGYESVKHVPQVYEYATARRLHDNTVPIRGRAEEVRPLGRRKDADTYWCRMKKDGSEDIEFVLYQTPVITFKKDGDVVVQTNGYSTISTHEFISKVLPSVSCRGQRGNTVLNIRGEGSDEWAKFVVPKNQALTLRMVKGLWTVPEPADNYEHRLDRKAAKAVRAKYKDFYTYVNSMVKIRAVEPPPRRYQSALPPVVEFTPQELEDVLGYEMHLVTGAKRRKRTFLHIYQNPVELDFYIRGDQSAEARNDNFHAAFVGMAMDVHDYGWEDHRLQWGDKLEDKPRRVQANLILKRIDEQILRAHAKDVLVWTRLPVGTVPNGKYKDWMKANG